MSEPVITFGSFAFLPSRRQLLRDGCGVRLGSRAMDLLVALLRNPGSVVSQDRLITEAWPNIHVEPNTLRVQIAALRKALGGGIDADRFIANIPGRGYAFVAPVREEGPAPGEDAAAWNAPPDAALGLRHLPACLTATIGRDDVIRDLAALLPRRRFITIVGPGGIGKTTVATDVARQFVATRAHHVAFVDLATITDPSLVAGAVASALELTPRADGPEAALAAFLRDRAILLLLDNCEHVADAVATLVETLLRGAPDLFILATSRETLRAEGEWVYRLPPLGLPPGTAPLLAAEALRYPAVQLFVERAAARLGGFELTDPDATHVAEICRRLDGIALAIELAAGRIDAFGLPRLASLLNDGFRILTGGRRTALPRHRTLGATMDWSFGLLSEAERAALRRLSVFAGGFSLSAAQAVVAGDAEAARLDLADHLGSLVAKSLVVMEVAGPEPQYRLLETTRAFARGKLDACAESDAFARRHAIHHLRLFERAEAEWDSRPAAEWLATYAPLLGDVRAALAWSFGRNEDAALGVALTVAAVPLWFQLLLVDEGLHWVGRALAMTGAPEPDVEERRRSMKLHAALGWLQMYASTRIMTSAEAWTIALRLAEALNEPDYRLRALWALWADRVDNADLAAALKIAQSFNEIAASDGNDADQLVGHRMLGALRHLLGHQVRARAHIEGMLRRYVAPTSRSDLVRFRFDQRVAADITRARILWVQGFADQAISVARAAVDQAAGMDHTPTLCSTLAQAACPIALLNGDLDAAEGYATLLRRGAKDLGFDIWQAYADGFEGEILVRRGATERGLMLLGGAVATLRQAGFTQYLSAFMAALARSLVMTGRPAEGLRVVHEALELCDGSGEGWLRAELERLRGEAVSNCGVAASLTTAEAAFAASLRTARSQAALAWELRTATSMAELRRRRGCNAEATALLSPVLARFTEGFGTEDLIRGSRLLDALEIGCAPTHPLQHLPYCDAVPNPELAGLRCS